MTTAFPLSSHLSSKTPVRVLIVDDSGAARAIIRALIESDPDLMICGEAKNGCEAISQVLKLKPQIITLDLNMPEMDGMTAIQEIMAIRPTPILVLSDQADAHHALLAVARGALEAIAKPTLDEGEVFTARIKMLANVPVIRHIRKKEHHSKRQAPSLPTFIAPPSPSIPAHMTALPLTGRVIAIAASTGGPQALALLLSKLPAHFPAPILIAQHISDGFAAAMAQWLNDLCSLPVTLAQDGEWLQKGHVYLADSTTHLTINSAQRIQLRPRHEQDIYRPSCDQLLSSVAQVFGQRTIGVILSGMGRDGARGIQAVRQMGGITLAQDEASSVIFGMNREAILAGAVQSVRPLQELAEALREIVGTSI